LGKGRDGEEKGKEERIREGEEQGKNEADI
jgi:hypothetical protein